MSRPRRPGEATTDSCRFEKGVRSEQHRGMVGGASKNANSPNRPLTMDKLHGISRGSSWRRTWRASSFVLAKAASLQCGDPHSFSVWLRRYPCDRLSRRVERNPVLPDH